MSFTHLIPARLQTLSHPGSLLPWSPIPDASYRGLPITLHLLINFTLSLALTLLSTYRTLATSPSSPYLLLTYTLSTFLGLVHTHLFTTHIISYQRAELKKQIIFLTSLLGPVCWVFFIAMAAVVFDTSFGTGMRDVEVLMQLVGAFAGWNVVMMCVAGVLEAVYDCRGRRGFGGWTRGSEEEEGLLEVEKMEAGDIY